MTAGRGYEDVDRQRTEIERTRSEFGETVSALAAKTDVKARGREKVAETRHRALDRSEHAVDSVRQKAAQGPRTLAQRTTETARSVGQKARQVPGKLMQTATRTSEALRQKVAKSATAAGPSGEHAANRMRTFVRRAGGKARQNPAGVVVGVAAAVGLALAQRYRQSARKRSRVARWGGVRARRSTRFSSASRQPSWRF